MISFDLRMYLEAENVRDTIYIEGTPTIEMTIKSTDMGDVAAAGLLVNIESPRAPGQSGTPDYGRSAPTPLAALRDAYASERSLL